MAEKTESKSDRFEWMLAGIIVILGLIFVYAYEASQGMLPK